MHLHVRRALRKEIRAVTYNKQGNVWEEEEALLRHTGLEAI